MRVERRHSDRVTLACPVTVRGVDEQGSALEFKARTTSINRHGAHLEVGQPLPGGQVLRLANAASQQEARFRVVGLISVAAGGGGVYALLGPLSAETPGRYELGADCVDSKAFFWGLYFPPLPSNDLTDWRVTLECRKCHATRALELSIVGMDVLESSGSLSLPCGECRTTTAWGYPEKGSKTPLGDRQTPEAVEDGPRRENRRVSLQVPVRVRRSSGEAEYAQSEDVSKGGFSFVSEIDYGIGEALMVACPYSPQNPNAEVQAQIARKQEIRGTGRKVFGVRYG